MTTVTQYFGAFRHNNVVVEYTSFATSGGSCNGPSRAADQALMLAGRQLAKLRAVSPTKRGAVQPPIQGVATPERTP